MLTDTRYFSLASRNGWPGTSLDWIESQARSVSYLRLTSTANQFTFDFVKSIQNYFGMLAAYFKLLSGEVVEQTLPDGSTMLAATIDTTDSGVQRGIVARAEVKTQTCSDARKDFLQKRKNDVCNQVRKCNDDDTPAEISRKIQRSKECIAIRKRITLECFGGVSDPGHDEQFPRIAATVRQCIKKLRHYWY